MTEHQGLRPGDSDFSQTLRGERPVSGATPSEIQRLSLEVLIEVMQSYINTGETSLADDLLAKITSLESNYGSNRPGAIVDFRSHLPVKHGENSKKIIAAAKVFFPHETYWQVEIKS